MYIIICNIPKASKDDRSNNKKVKILFSIGIGWFTERIDRIMIEFIIENMIECII